MNLAGQKRAAPGHVVLRVIEYQVDGGEVLRSQGADGIWRSSRKAVEAYQASKRRRRPKNTARSE
jgi:hypothetical protein